MVLTEESSQEIIMRNNRKSFGKESAGLAIAIFVTSTLFAQQKTKDSIPNLEEVKVVTGQYQPQSLKRSVYQVHVIPRQEIESRNPTNVLELLNNQLGFRFSPDQTLGETDINMMGMSGQNVKILLDGIPLLDRNATKQSISQIDVNNIDHIEYIEGPVSVVYGTDAQAGVINIITKKPVNERLNITARVQEESAGKEYNLAKDKGIHNENLSANYNKNGWSVNAYGTRNNFGGWQGTATGRQRQFLPKDQWLTGGALGYANQYFNLRYRLDYLNEDIYTPGEFINTPVMYGYIDAHYYTNRYNHILQGQWKINDRLDFTGSASYQDYTRKTKTVGIDLLKDSTWLSAADGAQDVSKFKTGFFRGTLQYKVSEKLSLQPGIEFKSDKASGARIEGTPSINDYAFFASAEWHPSNIVSIRPGVRLEKNSVYSAPPAIPSLNLKFALNENFSLRTAYGMGFRAPSLRELYFSFHDTNHDIDGNPNLKAEHSNSFNLYLDYNKNLSSNRSFRSVLGGFYNIFKNQITLAIDPDNSALYRYFNVDRFKTVGVSLENTYTAHGLSAEVGFQYIGRYNSLLESGSTFNDLPTFTWSPEVNANITYTLSKTKTQLGIFYKYTGKLPLYQSSDGVTATLAKTAAYNWMDVTLSQPIFGSKLKINIGVKNLFNVTNLANTVNGDVHSSGGPIAFSYGRSGFVGLLFNWNKK